LDYEFPLSVNLHALTVPDVSKGSSSQVDIVNFAFKIVVMMFLDMQDYPLYLDELAPSLDEQHRLNIIMFVKDFLEMRSASQLFMISHYAAMHGAFAQTDICVMDSTNVISLPAHFNQTVVIERG
jgi:ABC-type hemin transport system ATPase subunit